jgi:hypothetical protein
MTGYTAKIKAEVKNLPWFVDSGNRIKNMV